MTLARRAKRVTASRTVTVRETRTTPRGEWRTPDGVEPKVLIGDPTKPPEVVTEEVERVITKTYLVRGDLDDVTAQAVADELLRREIATSELAPFIVG